MENFGGQIGKNTRVANPTIDVLEKKVAALEEDPYAVARDPGLPLRRAFPKTSHLAPREAFGRSLPPRTVEAVLASGKDWRALREVATSMTD